MRLPFTLSFYIIKQFLQNFFLVFGVFTGIIIAIDSLEILRRAHSKELPFGVFFKLVFLKLPYLTSGIIPFCVLIGTTLCFAKLNKHSELVPMRSSGVSAWQFIAPVMLMAFIIGILNITFYNPVASVFLGKHERLDYKYLRSEGSAISISESGIWLSDIKDKKLDKIIFARSLYDRGNFLSEISIYLAGKNMSFKDRIEADLMSIKNGNLVLKGVKIYKPAEPPEKKEKYLLPTELVAEQIQDSLAQPETVSFWELPGFIKKIEAAGFSALKHKLQYYTLLILPFFFAALVLISGALSLSSPRKGKIGLMVVVGIGVGFVIYFLSKIISAIGLSGGINIIFASMTPVLICFLIGVSLMIHLEDG